MKIRPRGSDQHIAWADTDTDILNRHDSVKAAEARSHFRDFLAVAQYRDARLIVTERGRPAAALMPVRDLARLAAIEGLEAQLRGRGYGSVENILERIIEGSIPDRGEPRHDASERG